VRRNVGRTLRKAVLLRWAALGSVSRILEGQAVHVKVVCHDFVVSRCISSLGWLISVSDKASGDSNFVVMRLSLSSRARYLQQRRTNEKLKRKLAMKRRNESPQARGTLRGYMRE
jgi:hypothetical protein